MDVSTILKRVNSHKGKYLPHGYMHTGTESVSHSVVFDSLRPRGL